MIDGYDWAGGREAMLRFGPAAGPVVVVAQPLFEEANRTRRVIVATLRALADRGVAGALPDLPGQGESVVATEHARLADWQAAFAAAVDHVARDRPHTIVLAIRGGAMVAAVAPELPRWLLAPASGEPFVRELRRIAGDPQEPTVVAGNRLSPTLIDELRRCDSEMEPGTATRVVRFATDPRSADRHITGVAPWRRSEPYPDPALAATLASDIADWLTTCAS